MTCVRRVGAQYVGFVCGWPLFKFHDWMWNIIWAGGVGQRYCLGGVWVEWVGLVDPFGRRPLFETIRSLGRTQSMRHVTRVEGRVGWDGKHDLDGWDQW